MTRQRVDLGTWPTPLECADRLAGALGLGPGDLWIKRDDATVLGGGGNKIRKLEYSCAAALANGADTLLTSGAAQSNHARLTAAAGARLGLQVELVLGATEPDVAAGNVLLDALLGARIEWAGAANERELAQALERRAAELRAQGRKVEVLPYGGSTPLSSLGYVDCARELLEQLGDLDRVVVAVGSGGTMAGLVHALGARRVLGVNTGAVADPHGAVRSLLQGLRAIEDSQAQLEPIGIAMEQVGAGYSALTEQVASALRLAARTEGMLLDPIYTGRALAGLRAAVKRGEIARGERTVLLHSGGLAGLFGHPRAPAAAAGSDPPRTQEA